MVNGGFPLPGSFLRPKPTETITKDSETSVTSGSGNIPQAAVGMPVTAVLGRKRVPDANTIWTGNLRPLTETTVVTTTESEDVDVGGGVIQVQTTTKTVTTVAVIGYLLDIHMGICLGPDVHLVAIYIDNQLIWSGDLGPARETAVLPANETFLSGVSVVFSGGSYDQAPEPDIAVADYPGYVGIATVLLKGVRADLSMGNLSFEVVRVPNPLALSNANNRLVDDLNVISAAVEVITNEWGWGGLDISNVDTVTLSDMAIKCKIEGNFASVKLGSEVSIASLLKALQDQASAIFFAHPETGLVTGSLIRSDDISYVSGAKFYPGNIIEVRGFTKVGWQDTIEQARGIYTERDADYNDVPVFVQNTANISQSGRGKRTTTIQYPYSPTKAITSILIERDLALLAAPNYTFQLLTNRDGAVLLPGDIIIVTWPPYDLLNVPMLVLTVRKQDITANNVVLQLRQMKFPDTRALFGPGGTPYDPGFDTTPKTPLGVLFLTAPYFMARSRAGISTSEISPLVYALILPKPANDFQYSFSAIVSNAPGTSTDLKIVDNGLFPTFADLVTALTIYDDFSDGIITSITINNVINKINLVDVGNTGVREGRLFLICGNEIMSFESAVDNGDGSWTLNNVHRGLLDTVAEAHSVGADCYIVNNNFNYVSGAFGYPIGYTPNWIITSNSLNERGKRADGLVSTSWAPANNRTLSPPRPHNTKINATARSSTPVALTALASTTVTWSTRSRVSGTVRLQLDAADSPEKNGPNTQTHRVLIRDSANALKDCGTVVGNTLTFNLPAMALGAGFLYVQSEIDLGGVTYTSIAQDRIPIVVS